MTALRFPALLFLWLAIAVQAQTPAAAPGPGAIFGVVIDGDTKLPIRRASVSLSTVETDPQEALAWTDSDGRFSFGYLPPGRYQLRAFKDGYQPAAYGADKPRRPAGIIQLGAGEVRNDFVLRLRLTNSISGRVVDEDGDPLSGVQIVALTSGFQRHKRTLLPGSSAITDTDGHYRISGMASGRYAVAALHNFQQVVKVRPEATPGPQPEQGYSYTAQYYPGTDRPDSATLIPLDPGQEVTDINFQLVGRPAVPIQGTLVLPPGASSPQSISVQLTNQDRSNRMSVGAGINPPNLAFQFGQLPQGSYIVTAQATIDGKAYRGVQTIEAGPQGLNDVAVVLEPCVDISGVVIVEGPEDEKSSASSVGLIAADGLPYHDTTLRAPVGKDGSFKVAGVPAGTWDIDVAPFPSQGYVKSMMLGDQDVLTEEMVIRSSTAARLKIVLGTRAAVVQGDLVEADQPTRGMVLLAPEPKFRHVQSFYRTAAADDKGHFEIKNARPGKYQIFAFDEFDQQAIEDPDFLKPFESSGTTVTLQEGQNTVPKLSLIYTSRPAPAPRPPTAEAAPGAAR